MKSSSLNPKFCIINLKTIPDEGESFQLSNNDRELAVKLSDLLEGNRFAAQIHIEPHSDIYRVTGELKADLPSLCSRCAFEFNYALDKKFSEWIIVESKELGRKDSSKKNHSSDQWIQEEFSQSLEKPEFDYAQFLREQIIEGEPVRPLGGKNCDVSCENMEKALKRGWFDDGKPLEGSQQNPFEALKGLKIESPSKH